MTTDRPAVGPRFLVSGMFLLTCISIAAFKLPFHSELSWQVAPSSSNGLAEILAQAFVMMLLVIIERLSRLSARQVAIVLGAGVVVQTAGSALLAFPVDADASLISVAFGLRGAGSAPFLLAIGWVLGSMRPSAQKHGGKQPLSPEESLRASIDSLARTYSLSDRERDVALPVTEGTPRRPPVKPPASRSTPCEYTLVTCTRS